MKVLKAVSTEVKETEKYTCKNCNWTLTYSGIDLGIINTLKSIFGIKATSWFECPNCRQNYLIQDSYKKIREARLETSYY